MCLKFRCLIFLFVLIKLSASAQKTDTAGELIRKIQRGESDSVRFAANAVFLDILEKTLADRQSFEINFDSLSNVSVVSDGEKIRILTWVVPHYHGEAYDYFGFIQLRTDSGQQLIRLDDSTAVIRKPESEKLSPEKWLGAIYYAILPVKKSRKMYYTLLGWKGVNELTTEKVVEVLHFDKSKARFGFPLFKMGSVFKNRLLFAFNAQAAMTLRYDRDFRGIVFDRIGVNKNFPGQASGPVGTYDGLRFKRGRWVLYSDIDARTDRKPAAPVPENKP